MYYVNLFYKLFIPTVLGGMVVLVALDFSRLMINQRRRAAGKRPAKAQPILETLLGPGLEAASEETPVEASAEIAASEPAVEPVETEPPAPPAPTAEEPMTSEPDTPDEPITPSASEEQPGEEANDGAN